MKRKILVIIAVIIVYLIAMILTAISTFNATELSLKIISFIVWNILLFNLGLIVAFIYVFGKENDNERV